MKKGFSALMVFLEERTGLPENSWIPMALTAWDLLGALWPMNDVFRPKLIRIRALRYHARFEAEADEAVIAFSRSPVPSTWDSISSGAWRVLLERHLQMVTVCTANATASEKSIWIIPQELPEGDRTAAAVLEWWLEMKLPWKPRDPGQIELPEATHPGPIWPQ
ncbi:hypothetical protein [Azospirillum cavernae]|uniref:hypothetical protein n=1 Tax=Azospirillum cavernae TaxID=2320860 RepID=UPI0011C43800|nr:hypothetical protein [Azospirillum cavernae]